MIAVSGFLLVAAAGFLATVGAALLFAWLWYSGLAAEEHTCEMLAVEDRISDRGDCTECGATWAHDVVSVGPCSTMMQHEYTCRYALWAER